MKTMKKILSIISAGIMAMTCCVTAFADTQYYDTVIIDANDSRRATNIAYDDDRILAFETKHGGLYGEFTNKRYDFSINYIILHNDGIITPEWFELSDEYTVEQTAYDNETETYTVKVETKEELDKLYEASAELLEKGKAQNVYKQFTYEYSCFQVGRFYITLKKTDKDFNRNSIEGLENITFRQDVKNPEVYYCDYTLENNIALKNAQETIDTMENVKECRFSISACALFHAPNTIRIYANEIQKAKGDANDDTFVNVRDCSYIAKMIAYGVTEELSDVADFNKDGKVNIRDAAALAGYLVSLYDNNIHNPNV